MYVCFLPATDELRATHWLNRAAAYFSKSDRAIIHTELLFAEQSTDTEIIGQSCSIHYGGEVFFKPKRFSRTEWHFRLCPWDTDKALQFCEAHAGEKFNYIGYFLQPLLQTRVSSDRWFCSEIVAGALCAGGAEIPSAMHPDALYETLKDITTPGCPRQPLMDF